VGSKLGSKFGGWRTRIIALPTYRNRAFLLGNLIQPFL
jgi:hypothetical protein